jgi:hypothetical protein
MDEMLKEAGKTTLALANMLLVLFVLNHIFLGNLKADSGAVALIIYGETALYSMGLYLIKKALHKES